ncbi:ABC transporter ATP-binding protein [Paenibacillus massiliensis]|uniref:ABC transporter ATP-binding protein n=1 Tax=Paenibacillus massiliensis TaxID=225917 RepID=UPI000361AD3C|nr:ATP-binding cassette domain-containing protein [Paenibacillus massiliensis]
MLDVKKVSKAYEGRMRVKELDFSIQPGEIVGFLGPNGAGKTTTMRMITGYLYPTSGEVLVNGISVHDEGKRVRSRIGYLPETPPLYSEMSVQGYLRFVADLRNVPAREQKMTISEMISRLGLKGRERQLVRSLSKGYKQRLGLAGAILHRPDLLVLDEPTSGLDPNQIMEIRDLIRELGEEHTVLLSTHILPEVSMLCNRVLIIHEGKIVLDGDPQAMRGGVNEAFKVTLEVKGERQQVMSVLEGWSYAKAQVAGVVNTLAVDTLTEAERRSSHGENESLHEPANPGITRLVLEGNTAEDFREPLFYLLSEANLPILEMKREQPSLEQIFQQLTLERASSPSEEIVSAEDPQQTVPNQVESSGQDTPSAGEPESSSSTLDKQNSVEEDKR